ncbi:hypothetical protein JSY36_19965 [Bacillus sp. H-16]|uniref:PilN domain-containing protein n=1 Tax=Alteribacter salitolerans TaxID=2912333 RepID=UPI001965AEBB|nr:hypothetical protein [Alteribacter salitolerans]MBM7098001.1 hypothetical protein [Alteribacter salitolerans]
MPVEINLLPKKEQKDRSLLYVIGGFFLACFLAAAVFAILGSNVEQDIAEAETILTENKIASAEIEQEIHNLSNADQAQLSLWIEKLEGKTTPASAVLHEVVTRMPPEGYLVEYDYGFPFDVYIEAAFYEMRDLAYYHQALEESALISQVTLHRIDGEDMTGEDEEEEEETTFFTQPAQSEVYLPHYTAAMTITINPDAVRAHGEDAESDEPTGDEPGPPGREEDDTDVNIDMDLELDLEIDTNDEGNQTVDDEEIDNGEIDLDLEFETDETGGGDQ